MGRCGRLRVASIDARFYCQLHVPRKIVGELTEAKKSKVSKLNKEITSLREAHERNINELTALHESAITTLDQSQHAEIERLNQAHSLSTETQSQKLAELQTRLEEAESHKLIFELDEFFRCEVELEDYSDDEDDHTYRIRAGLKMRFVNSDIHPILVRRISLSLVRDAGQIETLLLETFPATWKVNGENWYFKGLTVAPSSPTDDHWFDIRVDVPHDLNQYMKPGTDLRITMDASRQKPYFVDLVINWRAAERGPHSIICFRSTMDSLNSNS